MSPSEVVRGAVAFGLSCCLAATVAAGAEQPVYGDPKAPVAGEVLGTVVHTRDAEELRYVVLRELTDRFATRRGITVTPDETQAYVRHVQAALRRDRERYAVRRDALSRQLAAGGLDEARRRALASELASVNAAIETLGPPGAVVDATDARAREEIAAAFIRQWKINSALHREYGGRVIFQQGGPEPLDAYRWFLEEARERGDFEILDKTLEDEFWRYYVTDRIHSFYRRGSREEALVFAVPPWSEAADAAGTGGASGLAADHATPDEGGPRNWEVTGIKHGLNLRERPSARSRIVAAYGAGTILDNLGCRGAEGRIWCDVQPLGGGPRGWAAASYLKPAVSPDGIARYGADDSALRAGRGRFDANGTLPCAQSGGEPLTQCAFGVARAGGGYSTVVVTRPDGRRRAIFFRMGRALGADTSQADGYPAFHAERETALHRIRVGDESYEIRDAVVLGG